MLRLFAGSRRKMARLAPYARRKRNARFAGDSMTIFITGVTGLIGSNLAACLLRAGHRVVAMARPGSSARVSRVLQAHPGHAADEFTLSDLLVVEGDVSHPLCGLGAAAETLKGQVDALAHCAADVSFGQSGHEEQRMVNVQGAENAAGLCAFLGAQAMLHVSTAYVDRQMRGLPPRTAYEKSKWDAEQALRRAAAGKKFRLTVARPSIVTGDRRNGFTPNFKGIYPFLKYGALNAEKIRKIPKLPHGLNPDGGVNLVPADFVAEIVRAAMERGCDTPELDIINKQQWTVAELINAGARFLGIKDCDAGRCEAGEQAESVVSDNALGNDMLLYYNANPELDATGVEDLREAANIEPVKNTFEWMSALLTWATGRAWEEI